MENSFSINMSIFPRIMTISLEECINGENFLAKVPTEFIESDSVLDLPSGAYLLYFKKIANEKNNEELQLLKKYARGVSFSDDEYIKLLNLIMTSDDRMWSKTIHQNFLNPFGVQIYEDETGKESFKLIEELIPAIRAQAWEYIIIDHLKTYVDEIIRCFNFNRKSNGNSEFNYYLGAWKFSHEDIEQSLSTALRLAFLFTLIGYCYGDKKSQNISFLDFFEVEFYKRVSLINGIWISKDGEAVIEYIPLFDSFNNLRNFEKNKLISIIKMILDNDDIAFDERETLKMHLLDGANSLHKNKNTENVELENNLIKPTINFIFLRNKAKEALSSAIILYKEGKYGDCANRSYYSMMNSIKILLENQGKLAKWKDGELKDDVTHSSIYKALQGFVIDGILDNNDEKDFKFVKDKRFECDYSISKFEKVDAENCVVKAQAFFQKIDAITS
ncbi:HEPN domain-containing protein [Acetobacterium carbinolicum]|uniref:HEPN domain-containing protein n=1 Tax=Acetobacterium carbinolicum TaxID=52690 RepID=UPI0039BEF840